MFSPENPGLQKQKTSVEYNIKHCPWLLQTLISCEQNVISGTIGVVVVVVIVVVDVVVVDVAVIIVVLVVVVVVVVVGGDGGIWQSVL